MRQKFVVAGGDLADTTTTAVMGYGFQVVFYPKRSSSGIELTKGAIIKTNFCSHELMWQVKNTYQSKQLPLFFCKGGFTHIKEEFEKKFVKPIQEEYKNLNKREMAIMLIGRFYFVGEKFKNHDLLEILQKYMDFSQGYMSVLCHELTDSGVFSKVGHGKYQWNGIDEKFAEKIAKHLPSGVVPPEYLKGGVKPLQIPEQIAKGMLDQIKTYAPNLVDPIQSEHKTIETVDSDKVPSNATPAPEGMRPVHWNEATELRDGKWLKPTEEPLRYHINEEAMTMLRDLNKKVDTLSAALETILKVSEINKIMGNK